MNQTHQDEPPIAWTGQPPSALSQLASAFGNLDRPESRRTVRRWHSGDARCIRSRGHAGFHLFDDSAP